MNREELAVRVLDAFPAGEYGLIALLRVMDVVPGAEVDTAAVECTAAPRMLINTKFVENHAETPEKLFMLVLHELHHVLLGHTRLFERSTPARNLVFDAVINSMLCRMFPGDAHTAMFVDYYSDERFPECLLRPPQGWSSKALVRIPKGLAGRSERLHNAYRALYSETGADYCDLFESLSTELAGIAWEVDLLGDHTKEMPELNGTGILFDAVREIVEKWPQPPNPIRGRSLADAVSATTVKPEFPRGDRAVLSSLIQRIAARGSGVRARKGGSGFAEAICPAPRPDRRSLVLQALGSHGLLYRTDLASPHSRGDISPVHVYVDVSGSVSGLRPMLYGAVTSCRELIHPVVHLFSTAVSDVSLRRFVAGECLTTGGTDIACVAEHIHAHKVRRAVLVTDGWVGKPRSKHARVLRACRLGVALTPESSQRDDLNGFADHWVQLKGTR